MDLTSWGGILGSMKTNFCSPLPEITKEHYDENQSDYKTESDAKTRNYDYQTQPTHKRLVQLSQTCLCKERISNTG